MRPSGFSNVEQRTLSVVGTQLYYGPHANKWPASVTNKVLKICSSDRETVIKCLKPLSFRGFSPLNPVDTTPALKSLWATWSPPPHTHTLKNVLMHWFDAEVYHSKSIIVYQYHFFKRPADFLVKTLLWKLIIEIQYTTIHGQNNHNLSSGCIPLWVYSRKYIEIGAIIAISKCCLASTLLTPCRPSYSMFTHSVTAPATAPATAALSCSGKTCVDSMQFATFSHVKTLLWRMIIKIQ